MVELEKKINLVPSTEPNEKKIWRKFSQHFILLDTYYFTLSDSIGNIKESFANRRIYHSTESPFSPKLSRQRRIVGIPRANFLLRKLSKNNRNWFFAIASFQLWDGDVTVRQRNTKKNLVLIQTSKNLFCDPLSQQKKKHNYPAASTVHMLPAIKLSLRTISVLVPEARMKIGLEYIDEKKKRPGVEEECLVYGTV